MDMKINFFHLSFSTAGFAGFPIEYEIMVAGPNFKQIIFTSCYRCERHRRAGKIPYSIFPMCKGVAQFGDEYQR